MEQLNFLEITVINYHTFFLSVVAYQKLNYKLIFLSWTSCSVLIIVNLTNNLTFGVVIILFIGGSRLIASSQAYYWFIILNLKRADTLCGPDSASKTTLVNPD